ncbi:hypothetical protein [Pseudomonas cerasi]
MHKGYASIIGIFIFLLAGCSTRWVKPNGSSPLWDLEFCDMDAEKRYPVKNEIVYRSNHDYSGTGTCSKKERVENKGVCRSQYWHANPDWDSEIIDLNRDTRTRFITNCMQSRGWTKSYAYPWR